MPFNPDDYLKTRMASVAKAPKGGFDPDSYLSAKGVDGAALSKTVNEMHPDFSVADRLIVKNFGNDIGSSIEYLQKKHPKMEIKQRDGEIVGRKTGEGEFRKLDPDDGLFGSIANVFTNPGEAAMDVGDLGYDVASGIGVTAATAGAGILGAGAGGVGAIPAAMAGGAASSAGAEGLRQWLGQKLGVNKDVSGSDIALAGGFGAAAPLLFGTGASAAQGAKAALRSGGDLTADQIMAAQRGLIGRSAAKVGELVSGVPEKAIKTAAQNMDEVTGIGSKLDYTTDLKNRTIQTLSDKTDEVGQAIETTVDMAQSPVALNPAKAVFDERIAKAQEQLSRNPSPVFQSKVDSLIEARNSIFPEGDTADARSAWDVMQSLKELGEVAKKKPSGLESRHSVSMSLSDKQLAGTATEAYKTLQGQIDTALKTDGLPPLDGLNREYGQLAKDKKFLSEYFKKDENIYTKLTGLGSGKKQPYLERIQKIDARHGTSIAKEADKLTANSYFGKPNWMSIGQNGSTSTSRTVPLSLAGGALGYYAGAQSNLGQGGAGVGAGIGGAAGALLGGPRALKMYLQTARNMQYVDDMARGAMGTAGQKIPASRAALQTGWNALTKGGDK